MKKKCILVFMIVLAMGMTACSSDSKENTVAAETNAERETENEDVPQAEIKPSAADTPKSDNTANAKTEPTADEETPEGDPVIGIVEKYADDIIIIKDPGDEILYYFSTKDAQIVEGDFPIAVGDKVEIIYRGLLGDEKNPAEAIKIVADIDK